MERAQRQTGDGDTDSFCIQLTLAGFSMLTLVVVWFVDASKSESDDDNGPVFSTYSSTSAFDKLSPAKKGDVSLYPPVGGH